MTPRRVSAGEPQRPARPALTRDHIVRTALAIIDSDGVAGLTMRRLGTELGVDSMAVYHHLPNKAALFHGVVEAVYAEVDLETLPETGTWRDQLTAAIRRIRQAFQRHPNALPVVATHPTTTPPMLAIADHGVKVLSAAGFAATTAFDIINCLGTYTIGQTLAEVSAPIAGDVDDPNAALAAMDPADYPHLVQAFVSGYDHRPDEQYELGLQAMLDGFERRRPRPGPQP
ncbi:MAG: TetR/AcrR family transcriptional regulator [Dactylosporangium sp.]|nr:TetR/AcrR family transcriptional regulator [Dactylosporangium sp.]NNJ60099.1 TetR/AcrR family transcriptional regulator [Dactylosporangium sp.]